MGEHDEKVKQFDVYFNTKYKKIKSSAVSILKHRDDTDDIIHDVYLKVRDRISRDGYDGDNFMGYLYRTFQNELRLAKNREKKIKHLDIDDENIAFITDWVMLDNEEIKTSTVEYREDILYITKMLFSFLNLHFSEKEQYLFRTYYLSKQKMTYKDLAKQTKYEYNSCDSIIKDMKKKIRLDFLNWLHNND